MKGAPFWSALFFLMLISLGLGSQIGIIEGVTSTLFDHPKLRNVNLTVTHFFLSSKFNFQVKKPVLTGGVALGCCSIGILFTTGAGEYWLTLFDSFGATGDFISDHSSLNAEDSLIRSHIHSLH